MSNLLCTFFAIAGGLYSLYALAAYRAALAQRKAPRYEDGEGGIFQRMNELRLRRRAKRSTKCAAVLIVVAVTIVVVGKWL